MVPFLFVGVQAWRTRTARGAGPVALVYSAYEVLAVLGLVASAGELFFNSFFIPWFVRDVVTYFASTESLWWFVGALLILAIVFRVDQRVKPWMLAALLVVQVDYMVCWMDLGFPVSMNVVAGAPAHPASVWVNLIEIGYYWLWATGWALALKRRKA